MKRRIKIVAKNGVSSSDSIADARMIALSNLMYVTFGIICTPWIGFMLFLGEPIGAGVTLFLVLALFAGLILNRYRKHTASKLMFVWVGNLALFFYSSSEGEIANVQLLFPAMMFVPLMLFDLKRQKWAAFSSMLLAATCWFYLEATDFYPLFYKVRLSLDELRLLRAFLTPTAALCMVFQVLYFKRVNDYYQAEIEVRSLQLQSVLDSVHGYIALIDGDGHYVLANPKLENSIGVSSGEIKGKPVGHFEEDKTLVEALKAFRNNLNIVQQTDTKKLKLRGGLEERWHLVSFQKIPNSSLLVFSAFDIHDEILLKNENEEQRSALFHASKMAALGEMASGIAHEINSPLAIIDVHARKIRRLVDEPSFARENIEKSLVSIETTIQRIVKIISGLKMFARNGNSDPMERCLVSKVTESAIEICTDRFRNVGINLIVSIPGNLEIDCRESQVIQVIVNLLNNSFDAVEHSPKSWVKVEGVERGEKIWIVVTDSGGGIPKEVVERIMHPFFTTKAPGKGTGLGLSISLGLIEGHHGRLFYDNTCSNTSFVIELPKPLALSTDIGKVDSENGAPDARKN